MIMAPKISVIIANYNNAQYLTDCLRSVATQSFTDFECIVVDDGSTDNSAKIIRKFANADSRFHPIFQKNSGVSAARNRGMDIARGEYISFLDSDDCFCPDALLILYNLATQNNADVVGGGGVRVADDFNLIDSVNPSFQNPPFKIYSNTYNELKILTDLPNTHMFVWVWRRLFRRSVIGKLRFDENLYPGEDTCFILSLFPFLHRMVETDAMVVYHRMARTAVSNVIFNQNAFAYITPTMRSLRRIMDMYYPVPVQKWFYKIYMDLVLHETIFKSMKTGRLMYQVADHLRPIYGTPVLPTKYLPWPQRLIFWLFMKVF